MPRRTTQVARTSRTSVRGGLAAQCQLGPRPRDDGGYFEHMTKVIFRVGLNRVVVEKKWPGFRKAFEGFAIEKVAAFDGADILRLMRDDGIVRNERKVTATIENARTFMTIRAEHGSFARYLRELTREGEEGMCKALSKRFSFLGGSSALFFLRSVGEEMPETMRRRAR